tara:strand:- start:340 stop:1068 length:729 start_codon:yes stop_codon:yes gene_type:complete
VHTKKITELFLQIKQPKDLKDYYHNFNRPNILNVIYWMRYFDLIKNIEGDIIECGVGRGRSLITLMTLNKLFSEINPSLKRKIIGLDSFEGFPEPTAQDKSSRNPKKGEWNESPNKEFKYSKESLQKIIKGAGLGDIDSDSSVEIIKGFFEDTTKDLEVNKISILHLDGDLYNSVLTPMNNLWEKISLGGLIVIDDYIQNDDNIKNEAFPGARKAVSEFLSVNKNFDLKISLRGSPYLMRIS